MDQNTEISSARRFIFDDSFYDNFNSFQDEPTNTEPEKIDIPVPEIKPLENENKIDTSFIEENNFNNNLDNSFNNSVNNEVINQEDASYNNNSFNNDNIMSNNTVSNNDVVNNDINSLFNIEKQADYNTYEQPVVEKRKIVIEPPVDKPVLFENNIQEPVDKPNLLGNSVVEPVNNNTFDSFNVETGINTDLEKELISAEDVYKPSQDFNYNPYPFDKKDEPVKYRARNRNNNVNSNPIYTGVGPISPNVGNIPKPTNRPIVASVVEDWKPPVPPAPIIITEEIDYSRPEILEDVTVVKSNLIEELIEKENKTRKISVLARYGDDFCNHDYVTNPAIGRDKEIKELELILLTVEKSAILVGKPGIGKTSIVEGLAYRIQRNQVPDALKGYTVVSVKTTSLLGQLPNGETRLQTLIDEIKDLDKIILFIDEIHMLMGATNESSLDFANMFKESLGRGNIKMIGATTTEEYEKYVLRDKAFVRRFQKVDVFEPTRDQTIEILMGTLPKIEKKTGVKMKYTHYVQSEIMAFIVDITTEYKRIYGIGSRYPDICITLVNQAFSNCVFDNRKEVNILDIRHAIENSKNIYPDVIRKELINFDTQFKEYINSERTA